MKIMPMVLVSRRAPVHAPARSMTAARAASVHRSSVRRPCPAWMAQHATTVAMPNAVTIQNRISFL